MYGIIASFAFGLSFSRIDRFIYWLPFNARISAARERGSSDSLNQKIKDDCACAPYQNDVPSASRTILASLYRLIALLLAIQTL